MLAGDEDAMGESWRRDRFCWTFRLKRGAKTRNDQYTTRPRLSVSMQRTLQDDTR